MRMRAWLCCALVAALRFRLRARSACAGRRRARGRAWAWWRRGGRGLRGCRAARRCRDTCVRRWLSLWCNAKFRWETPTCALTRRHVTEQARALRADAAGSTRRRHNAVRRVGGRQRADRYQHTRHALAPARYCCASISRSFSSSPGCHLRTPRSQCVSTRQRKTAHRRASQQLRRASLHAHSDSCTRMMRRRADRARTAA
jgi:hypothetical protein